MAVYNMIAQTGGGVTPSGTYSISANGVYDVMSYASADVSVPSAVLISQTFSSNGTYDALSDSADGYSQVTVNVPDSALQIIERTISSTYENSLATVVGRYAFCRCDSLEAVSMPNVSTISNNAFYACSNLREANFPSADYLGESAFGECELLESVNIPLVERIRNKAFAYCYSLNNVVCSTASRVSTGAFAGCSALSTLSFPKASTIEPLAFDGCRKLLSFYLMGSAVATLSNVNAFGSTPISNYTTYTSGVNGSIFVPSSLYNTYIAAANWSDYAARIVSM